MLEDPESPEVARDNALRLLDAAWEAGRGRLPADWTVPSSIHHLRVSSLRKQEPDGVSFRLELGGIITDPGALGQVRVVQAPGRVILDRRAGQGTWEVTPEPDGTWYVELEGPETATPTPEGLYLLDVEVAGEDVRGWFVLTRHVSSQTPAVHAPAVGETFTSGQPPLRLDDFRSPEYRAWERRSLGLYVVRLRPGSAADKGYEVAWHRWISSPRDTEVTLGVGGDMPDAELEDGDYWLAATYGERRAFGPLKIVRSSRTARPFQVRAGPPR